MKVKLIHKHSKSCQAPKEWPSNPWAFLGSAELYPRGRKEPIPPVLMLSETGRRHRHAGTRWVTAGCNYPDCEGAIAIRERDILEAAQRGLASEE